METKPSKSELALQVMITEYESLQRARDSVLRINENRANFFFTSITITVIFLTFVFETMGDEMAKTISIVLLTSLFLLGIVTFSRVIEGHIANLIYVRGMNRIRRYFSEYAPETLSFFILPITDNVPRFHSVGFNVSGLATWFTLASIVGIINSAVLSANALILVSGTRISSFFVVLVSISVFLLSLFIHQRYQISRFSKAEKEIEVRFPR